MTHKLLIIAATIVASGLLLLPNAGASAADSHGCYSGTACLKDPATVGRCQYLPGGQTGQGYCACSGIGEDQCKIPSA